MRCSQIRVPIRGSWRGLHHGCAEIGRRQLWSSLRSDTTPYWTKTSLQTSGHPDGDGDLEFLVDLVDLMDICTCEVHIYLFIVQSKKVRFDDFIYITQYMQLAWLGFESNFVFTHQLPGISWPKTCSTGLVGNIVPPCQKRVKLLSNHQLIGHMPPSCTSPTAMITL